MKKKLTNLLFPLSTLSIILLSTGCAPKNADGSYASAYSYDPYIKARKSHHRPLPAYRNVAYHHNTYKSIRPNPRRRYAQKIRPIYYNNRVNITTPVLSSFKRATNNYRTKRIPNFSYSTNSRVTNNIERTAKSLLGTDYQYGANGPYQYDCSSFTKYVFAKQGINLPRVSRDQAKRGQYVSANQLQKGDLIFFDSKKSSKVSHVGIYLGGGNFIHASSAQDKVTISNLSSDYYAKHFKWGRRVTNFNYAMK